MATIYELSVGGKTKKSRLGVHPVTIDWDALPENAKDFAIRYGLRQYLADAMAGASDEGDARAKVVARLDKLTSGDLSRAQGLGLNRPDTIESRAAKLARQDIVAALKTSNVTATKEQIAAAVTALVAKDDKYKTLAAEQIAAEGKMKAAGLDLAALGIIAPEPTDDDESEEEDESDETD